MAKIRVTPYQRFDLFLSELHNRSNIRFVRLADYGLVEPAKRSGAFVMQPMVRVVASAFDRDKEEILRWQEQKDANQMVTIVAGRSDGLHSDQELVARKEELRAILQDEGFQVDEGEWTSENANAFLQTRKRVVG